LQLTYQDALERLLVGNRRYAAMRQVHPRQTTIQRQTLVEGQHPFAAVLSCSDSRVPSELIFDQGLGDLFIVRTAGHAVNTLVLASLEYAVFALSVPLVMVLGHGGCGAVTAVMNAQTLPGHMPELADHLRPALESMPADASPSLEMAIQANSRYTAAYIRSESAILAEAVGQDRLRVVAAYYDLVTGRVIILD
jgi:carbonic anhydrase